MAMGQTLNMLEQRLLRVYDKVHQVMLEAVVSGRAAGAGSLDPSQAARVERLGRKLAGVDAELLQIMKVLKQNAHLLDQRERIAWRVPREFRYRERQSIRSHATRQREVYQLLQDILQDLDDLMKRTGDLTSADLINLANGLKSNLTESAHSLQEVQTLLAQPTGPAFTTPTYTVNVSWASMVMMAYVMVVWLRDRARRRGDSA